MEESWKKRTGSNLKPGEGGGGQKEGGVGGGGGGERSLRRGRTGQTCSRRILMVMSSAWPREKQCLNILQRNIYDEGGESGEGSEGG